jgi:phospholipase/lecithinase/hemolysin
MSSFLSRTLVLGAILFLSGLSATAHADSFAAVVVYGDSLSDNGNLYAATGQPPAPYYAGRLSNGPVAVEQLATKLGAPLVDFAWGGATTGIGNSGDGGSPTSLGAYSLPGMQAEFAASKPAIAAFLSSGLFIVWGGPDDFLSPSPLDATTAAVVNRAVADELGIVNGLEQMGAQHILVPGMPDLGLTPYYAGLGQAAEGTAIANAFNAELTASLPAGVLYYNTEALLQNIVANPAAYGFTNVTQPCFNGVTVCSDPSQYLFFDDFHPTTAADAFAAEGFLSVVAPEPASFALVLGGLALLFARRRK